MLKEDFNTLVEMEHEASLKMLGVKREEYVGENDDCLRNFKGSAGLRHTNPVDALVGMVVKQWQSVSDMAKDPTHYTVEQWNEKLRDIRNYTYLAKACVLDMMEEAEQPIEIREVCTPLEHDVFG